LDNNSKFGLLWNQISLLNVLILKYINMNLSVKSSSVSLVYLFIVFASLLFISGAYAQPFFDDGLTPAFHQGRREALRSMMPPSSIAIFFNSPHKRRSADTDFPYRPDSDFYYLTGLREPNAALIIFKDVVEVEDMKVNEMIFVQPRNPRAEQWDGPILGPERVKEYLGFQVAFEHSDFLKRVEINFSEFSELWAKSKITVEPSRSNQPLIDMMERLDKSAGKESTWKTKSLDKALSQLRSVKTTEEIEILRTAITISGYGHIEAIKSIQPGVSERAIQGVHEFVHKAMGAEAVGYGSIVGAGNNATILHYVSNDKVDLKSGLLLMDVGAEYRGYSGDITRTVPIKGTFSPEEKIIYELVLEALYAGIDAAKPGTSFRQASKSASDIISKGLKELGILEKSANFNPYYPHGLGHHLGLDVHDPGSYDKLEPGMVLTVEPGIYIPEGSKCDEKWWGIGIRIEDNILITNDGNINLTEFVPKTVEDIEALMKHQGILQALELK